MECLREYLSHLVSALQETWSPNTSQINYMVMKINIYTMTYFGHIDEFVPQGIDFVMTRVKLVVGRNQKRVLLPSPPKVEEVTFSPLSCLFLAKSKIFQVYWLIDLVIGSPK